MSFHPDGPAALIEKATGVAPIWAMREHVGRSDFDGSLTFRYSPTYLGVPETAEIAALTDPRVGWRVEVRVATEGRYLTIRAKKGVEA